MNWDAVSAIAEVIGMAAVVVSVLYLAAQVRRQTKEIRTAAIHETTQNYTEAVTPYLDPQLADLWTRGTKDFDSLSDGERIQMISAFTINLRSFQDAFYQAEANRLDAEVWKGIVNFYAAVLSTPGASRIWELRKSAYSAKFQDFIDSIERTSYKID